MATQQRNVEVEDSLLLGHFNFAQNYLAHLLRNAIKKFTNTIWVCRQIWQIFTAICPLTGVQTKFLRSTKKSFLTAAMQSWSFSNSFLRAYLLSLMSLFWGVQKSLMNSVGSNKNNTQKQKKKKTQKTKLLECISSKGNKLRRSWRWSREYKYGHSIE